MSSLICLWLYQGSPRRQWDDDESGDNNESQRYTSESDEDDEGEVGNNETKSTQTTSGGQPHCGKGDNSRDEILNN